MDRRQMLGVIGAGTAGMFAMGGSSARADHQDKDKEKIEVIGKTARACAMAAQHCLKKLEEGTKAAEKHAKALRMAASCEEFCILSAKESACDSPLAHLAPEANAEACEQRARACEAMDSDAMKECVECCRECAKMCREMARRA